MLDEKNGFSVRGFGIFDQVEIMTQENGIFPWAGEQFNGREEVIKYIKKRFPKEDGSKSRSKRKMYLSMVHECCNTTEEDIEKCIKSGKYPLMAIAIQFSEKYQDIYINSSDKRLRDEVFAVTDRFNDLFEEEMAEFRKYRMEALKKDELRDKKEMTEYELFAEEMADNFVK